MSLYAAQCILWTFLGLAVGVFVGILGRGDTWHA
jgi:hypothetical protein